MRLLSTHASGIESSILVLNTTSKNTFDCLEEENLFTAEFQLFHPLAEVLRFGDLSFLQALIFVHFKYIRESFIKIKSTRKLRTMEATDNAMKMFSTAETDDVPNIPRTPRAKLSREGVKISLDGFTSNSNSNFVHLTVQGDCKI